MGDPADVAPRIVGRYAIFDEIGSGGMATVYLGRLMGSGGFARTVAIKRLHPQFAKDPEFVTMFLDEARLAARIRHPNVVPTLDVVAASGELFHVMEYVQGESLSHLSRSLRLRGERIPLPILVRVINDMLQGLHAAHEARDERGVPLQIVHRDVTPQNVLVGVDGVARLLDFGVAKAAGRAQTTQDGQIKGKLAYMAPEQLMSAGVTRETDLYSASVVLWEMLTGERLFTGESELDVVAKLLQRDIQPPSKHASGVPAALDALVMRGLSAKMEDRFASARDMSVALAECGIAEATSLAVGEWVERLAAKSLADRTAKVAAIESEPDDLTSSVTRSPLPAGEPTVVEGLVLSPARHSVRLSDVRPRAASHDPLSVTLSANVLRRRARLRLGVAAVIGSLVATIALAVVSRHLLSSARVAAPAASVPSLGANRLSPTPEVTASPPAPVATSAEDAVRHSPDPASQAAAEAASMLSPGSVDAASNAPPASNLPLASSLPPGSVEAASSAPRASVGAQSRDAAGAHGEARGAPSRHHAGPAASSRHVNDDRVFETRE